MKKKLHYNSNGKQCAIHYSVYKHPRAKHLKITVSPDASVRLTVPRRVNIKTAEQFLHSRIPWITAQQAKLAAIDNAAEYVLPPVSDKNSYLEHKEAARELVHVKLLQFNEFYRFTYGTVSIRNQRTRWGSCSANGNLSFNYRIVLLEPKLQDYIIVHELCHLKEMNHSKQFWKLVGKTIPDGKALAKQVRNRSIK